jgi:hypothetical protein
MPSRIPMQILQLLHPLVATEEVEVIVTSHPERTLSEPLRNGKFQGLKSFERTSP